MANRLTANGVAAVKADGTRQQIRDGGCDNLWLIVQPSGSKSWAWRGRQAGKPVKFTLGSAAVHSLADAREWANRISAGRDAGVNVVAAEAAQKAEEAKLETRTCDWSFGLYMESEGEQRKSASEKWRLYRREISPHIGTRSIYSITHDDLANLLQRRVSDSPSVSNAMQSLIRRWWRWSITLGRHLTGLTSNPAADVVKLGAVKERTRYLNDYEIGLLMRVLDSTKSAFRDPFWLLLYTGTRRSEVFELPWEELDELDSKGLWIIPGARTKNRLDHVVPLPVEMVTMLQGLRAKRDRNPLVWPSGGDPDKPMSGFSKAIIMVKAAMDKLAAEDGRTLKHWSTHDLRRTLDTGMNALKGPDDMPIIPDNVVERVINHKLRGMKGVYNRHAYQAEKRAALRLWADHLASLRRVGDAPESTPQPQSEPIASLAA